MYPKTAKPHFGSWSESKITSNVGEKRLFEYFNFNDPWRVLITKAGNSRESGADVISNCKKKFNGILVIGAIDDPFLVTCHKRICKIREKWWLQIFCDLLLEYKKWAARYHNGERERCYISIGSTVLPYRDSDTKDPATVLDRPVSYINNSFG